MEAINLGNAEFLFGYKSGKYDPFDFSTLQLKVLAGSRLLLVGGFDQAELNNFKKSIVDNIDVFLKKIEDDRKSHFDSLESEESEHNKYNESVNQSLRARMQKVLFILKSLQERVDSKFKDVAIDDLQAEAESQGIDCTNIIGRLEREGFIIYTKPNFIRAV